MKHALLLRTTEQTCKYITRALGVNKTKRVWFFGISLSLPSISFILRPSSCVISFLFASFWSFFVSFLACIRFLFVTSRLVFQSNERILAWSFRRIRQTRRIHFVPGTDVLDVVVVVVYLEQKHQQRRHRLEQALEDAPCRDLAVSFIDADHCPCNTNTFPISRSSGSSPTRSRYSSRKCRKQSS